MSIFFIYNLFIFLNMSIYLSFFLDKSYYTFESGIYVYRNVELKKFFKKTRSSSFILNHYKVMEI